jgi:hypothetical protein
MEAESQDKGRLRVGPWIPDPVDRPRSASCRSRHPESGIDAVGRRADPLSAVMRDPADRGWRRRHAGTPTRRRWMVTVAAVVGLSIGVGVPLLRAGHPAPPAAPALSTATGAAGAPTAVDPDSPDADASPSPSLGQSTAAPRSAVPSRPVRRPPAPPPVVTTYEAEDPGNSVGGTARVDDYPGAAGGRIVRNIGNWEGSRRAGWVRFNNVTAPRTGTYLLTFFYVHLDDTPTRTAVIEVSGSAPVSVTVTGSATCCAAARQQIVLRQGVNSITFTNADDHAPSLDRIVVSSA